MQNFVLTAVLVLQVGFVGNAQTYCSVLQTSRPYSITYDWYWLEDQSYQYSGIDANITVVGDTIFAISNSQPMYSLDGRSWSLYHHKVIDSRISGIVYFNNQSLFVTEGNLVDGQNRIIGNEAYYSRGWVKYMKSDTLVVIRDNQCTKKYLGGYRVFDLIHLDNSRCILRTNDTSDYNRGKGYFLDISNDLFLQIPNGDLTIVNQTAFHNDTLVTIWDEALFIYTVNQHEVNLLDSLPVEQNSQLTPIWNRGIILDSPHRTEVIAGKIDPYDLRKVKGDRISEIGYSNGVTYAHSKLRGSVILSPNQCVLAEYYQASSTSIDGLYSSPTGCYIAMTRKSRCTFNSESLLAPRGTTFSGECGFLDLGDGSRFHFSNDNQDTLYKDASGDLYFLNGLINFVSIGDTLGLLSAFKSKLHIANLRQGIIQQTFHFNSPMTGTGLLHDTLLWVGTTNGLHWFSLSGKEYHTSEVSSVRSVLAINDGYLISSYGNGLFFTHEIGQKVKPVAFNIDDIGSNLSGVHIIADSMVVILSNKGVFVQNRYLIESLMEQEMPLYFVNALKEVSWKAEVNGSYFSTILVDGDTIRVPTTLGVLTFVIKNMGYSMNQAYETSGLGENVIFESIDSESKTSSKLFAKYEGQWELFDGQKFKTRQDDLQEYAIFDLDHGTNNLDVTIRRKDDNYLLLLLGVFGLLGSSVGLALYLRQRWKYSRAVRLQSQSLNFGWKFQSIVSKEDLALEMRLIEHDVAGAISLASAMLKELSKNNVDLGGDDLYNLTLQSLDRTKSSVLSRVNSLDTTKEASKVELNSIVDEVLGEAKSYLTYKKIQVSLIKNSDLEKAKIIDAVRFTNCFRVILGNAIKFSSRSSTIEINLSKNHSFVKVAVRDYGLGLPEGWSGLIDTIERRNGAAGEAGSGSALKLAAKSIESIGGDIILEPHPVVGTIAIVRWPIDRVDLIT